jgi:hypothetical protein
MIAMRVMKMAINQIVDMFAMGHHFVSALRPVGMLLSMTGALVPKRAVVRIGRCYTY